MKIGALQKVSLIEYPGQISAVVFTQGCNFRCPYCHNPELVRPEMFGDIVEVNSVLAFLARRRGKLDAVVVTGGEPTIHKGLPSFLKRIKSLGFSVKVDTNGSQPEVVKSLAEAGLVDYIAMDIKTAPERYDRVTATPVDPDLILKTIATIMAYPWEYEFRTTMIPGVVTEEDFQSIAKIVRGARRYVIQRFLPSKHVEPLFSHQSPTDVADLEKVKRLMEDYTTYVSIR
ncbi:MAG: anaerobic ribonucleoside-triphosphate reductase activating protein [Syntrophales bacterium]|nr:anaerobic ribonucleoside-triphosphate reductase activating protein [Syntrophales bacterium]